MADVRPLGSNRHLPPPISRPSPFSESAGEPEGLDCLRSLIAQGVGFAVALTPEYIEGAGRDVPQSIMGRLHRGDFSIQGHIDLHGLTLEQARPAFDSFLSDALATGKRAVLIVHGRGLSSPGAPVLKTRVAAWLSSGPWEKWVIAFASARSCDGGAGATYVLLRQRPRAGRHPENGSTGQIARQRRGGPWRAVSRRRRG